MKEQLNDLIQKGQVPVFFTNYVKVTPPKAFYTNSEKMGGIVFIKEIYYKSLIII